MTDDDHAGRYRAARNVTLIGAGVDGALGIGKVTVGVIASSQALLADGIHSLSDLFTDAGVLFIARLSNAAPDQHHPYGHERFETLGTLALGAVLLIVAGGLAYDSLLRLLEGRVSVPGSAALLVAVLSIAAKEVLYRITRRVALEHRSALLLANAWHSRSDALSSIAVLIGVGGAMAGWPWLDLAAALVVAAMIAWIGWKLLARSAQELVDTGLAADELAAMRLTAGSVSGVVDVHRLKSRRMGSAILLDMDIVVDPELTVSEGHQVAGQVQQALRTSFPDVRAVQVHVDANTTPFASHLPTPAAAREALLLRWRPLLGDTKLRLALHYRPNAISAELFLESRAIPGDMNVLRERLRVAADDLAWLDRVLLWWGHPHADGHDARTNNTQP